MNIMSILTLNGMDELAPMDEFTSKLSAFPNKLKNWPPKF